MLGEMKNEIMTQVDAVIKKQLSSVIKEMKFQMKDMFKVMMTEMTTTNTNNENNGTIHMRQRRHIIRRRTRR